MIFWLQDLSQLCFWFNGFRFVFGLMGLGKDLGFWVWDVGFQGFGYRVSSFGFRGKVWQSTFFWDLMTPVMYITGRCATRTCFRDSGFSFRVLDFGFRDPCSEFRVLVFGVQFSSGSAPPAPGFVFRDSLFVFRFSCYASWFSVLGVS